MSHRNSSATVFLFISVCAFLAAYPARAEPWRFAFMADHRSADNGSGVNEAAVTAIAQQISGRGDVQFVLVGGDLVNSETSTFTPPPAPPLAAQFQTFNNAMSAGGLVPAGTAGPGISFYAIRGNHETYALTSDPLVAWNNAYGQYLPQNGPTTGHSEVGMTYSFRYQNVLILGVEEYLNAPDLDHPQVNQQWVNEQLAGNQDHVIVFGHTPAYQANHVNCLAANQSARDDFLGSLYDAEGPDGHGGRIYLCGHDHHNALARVYAGGQQRFYQMLIGGGGAPPAADFDGVYSKDYPQDAALRPAADLYHDDDHGRGIPFYYTYAVISVDGDSLWLNLYGTESVDSAAANWQLLYTVVVNGSMPTTAAELGASGVANDAQVVFNQQVNGTYSGVMQGIGSLVKTGPGTLELTGANTYSGGTIVEQGRLSVNNTAGSGTGTGSVLVQPAGILGGNGAITGDVTNQGTLAPGNSIGTLTINGQYVHQSGATYEVELNAAGASDLLRVQGAPGTADLQGGTVRVIPETGAYVGGTRYAILTAGGGVTGAFEEVLQPSAILHFDLDTLADEVDLVLLRNTFASQAATPYQASVGGALDQYPVPGSGDMQNVIDQLSFMDQSTLQLALTQLGPMIYDDMTSAALSGGRIFSNTLRNRFGEIHCLRNACCCDRNRIWARGFSNWSSEAGTPIQQPGYRYTLGGGAVGLERCFGEELLGGVSIGYSGVGLAEYEALGSGDLDILHTALYGTWIRQNGFYMDAALGWGYDWYDNTRRINTLNRTADSRHNGQEYMVYLDAGVEYPVGHWTIDPQAVIQYVHVSQNGFEEQNAGDVGLLIDGRGADSLQTRLGVEAARPLCIFNHRLIPRLRAEWVHEYCGSIRAVPAHFSGMPDVLFLAPGRRYKIDGAVIGGGFDACLTDNVTAYLNYDLPLMGDSNIINGYSLWAGIGAGF
jgi:outer membrane autotransporter protein